MGLIALAVMASFIAGVSPIAGYSPMIVGGIVIAAFVGALLLQKPTWALYAAIFVILLPSARGESSLAYTLDKLQSVLNRSVTLIALISWLLSVITRRRRIVWTRTALLMLGFLSWAVITLSWAPDLGRGVDQLGQYAFRWLLFLLLIANIVDTKETLDGLMRILAASGWFLILSGVGAVLFQGYEPGIRLQVLGMNVN